MITVRTNGEELLVEIAGKDADVLDAGDDYVRAECDLNDLAAETVGDFPQLLQLQIQSGDGFGTYFFHELLLSYHPEGVVLEFRCHTSNKYWEQRRVLVLIPLEFVEAPVGS
jgi:hypothetical protein